MQVCCKQSVYCIKACINLVYTHTHAAELEEFVLQSQIHSNAVSVQEVVLYLKACQQMFERGILGYIKSMDSPLICSMKRSYQYFSEWANKLVSDGKS